MRYKYDDQGQGPWTAEVRCRVCVYTVRCRGLAGALQTAWERLRNSRGMQICVQTVQGYICRRVAACTQCMLAHLGESQEGTEPHDYYQPDVLQEDAVLKSLIAQRGPRQW